MLGITQDFKPRFLRQYANLNDTINDAVSNYTKDVKSGDFPNEKESY
jgi:3-methyl-2-oxobutanoate hydroxymethyltransferase